MPTATYSDIDWDEATRYFESYLDAVDVLNRAKLILESLAQKAIDPRDYSKYYGSALKIAGELELLKNKRRAFRSNAASITPPSDAVVEKIAKLSEEVAQFTATADQYDDIIEIVTETVNELNSIQSAT